MPEPLLDEALDILCTALGATQPVAG